MEKHRSDEAGDSIQREIYRRMTPSEKWLAAWHLRQSAWEIKRAALTCAHPDWNAEQIEAELKRIFLHASS